MRLTVMHEAGDRMTSWCGPWRPGWRGNGASPFDKLTASGDFLVVTVIGNCSPRLEDLNRAPKRDLNRNYLELPSVICSHTISWLSQGMSELAVQGVALECECMEEPWD
jgi:hypothetical protein